MIEEMDKKNAEKWAEICSNSDDYGCCPMAGFGKCPWPERLCAEIEPEDWIKWMEEK